MEVESVKCECCGLKEDCTREYIRSVRSSFNGDWLCGLCSEAVRDETKAFCIEEAMRAHMSFCKMANSNPAVQVADGMKQMLRRRSGNSLANSPKASSSKRYSRSA